MSQHDHGKRIISQTRLITNDIDIQDAKWSLENVQSGRKFSFNTSDISKNSSRMTQKGPAAP